MSATLAEIKAAVRRELSEDDSDFFTDAFLVDAANRGQDAIATDCPRAALDAFATMTVRGSRRYVLPEDCVQPTEAWITPLSGDAYRLSYIEPDLSDTRRRGVMSRHRGSATYRSTRDGVCVEINPAPSESGATLTIVSHIRPRVLVEDTDRTDIEARFVYILIYFVLGSCKRKDEEDAQADRYRHLYETEMAKLAENETRVQADQHNTVKFRRSIRGPWGPWGGDG